MKKVDRLIELIHPELVFSAAKSSGPGGQHVNKTNTKVFLRWDLNNSEALSKEERKVIMEKLNTIINKDEILIISDQSSRSQIQNKANALKKLDRALKRAFYKPKSRKPTKPTRASVKKRLEAKKRLSEKKQQRRKAE
jgi:ribosome-associated protein